MKKLIILASLIACFTIVGTAVVAKQGDKLKKFKHTDTNPYTDEVMEVTTELTELRIYLKEKRASAVFETMANGKTLKKVNFVFRDGETPDYDTLFSEELLADPKYNVVEALLNWVKTQPYWADKSLN